MKCVKCRAPGKIILSGEHAVLYGQPVLVTAINRYVEVKIESRVGAQILISLPDLSTHLSCTTRELESIRSRARKHHASFLKGEIPARAILSHPSELVCCAIAEVLKLADGEVASGFHVTLRSSVPLGAGLGSSAACIVGILKALMEFCEIYEKCHHEILPLASQLESLQHGRTRGQDIFACLNGGLSEFQTSERGPLMLNRRDSSRQKFSLVFTGKPESSTGECVQAVSESFSKSDIWSEFGQVTRRVAQALESENTQELSSALQRNEELLETIGIVPKRVKEFLNEIEKLGGVGKVCGAGAVRGDAAGAVLLSGNFDSDDLANLCFRYGYEVIEVTSESEGAAVFHQDSAPSFAVAAL